MRPDNETSSNQQAPHTSDTATGSEANAMTLIENQNTAPPESTTSDKPEDHSQYARSVRDLIRRVRGIVVPRSAQTPLESIAETVIVEPFMAAVETLPAQIGRFRIERLLGRGGFGLVFVAYDPELDRHVALKIPRIEALAMSDGPARFLREARAAAMLGHPNIVPVYEAGNAGPSLYLTMELIHGPTLAQWIHSRTELPQRADCRPIAQLIATLAFAVQHAHSRGIIHRDLKPSNVLLQTGCPVEEGAKPADQITSEELSAFARIADFGMAQMILADGLQTVSGAVVGTPSYMAPEQIKASNTPIQQSTDVYGLGTILYELLTGQPPFTGISFAGVLKSVAEDSVRSPARLNPHVPRDLEAICLKCLEKEPRRRYENAVLLAEDLERFIHGEPVQARRISMAGRCWRWARRNRLIAASLAMAFSSLLAGLGAALYQARVAKLSLDEVEKQRSAAQLMLTKLLDEQEVSRKNLKLAQTQEERAERHLERTEQAIDQLLNRVADELALVPRMAALRTELLQQALKFESEIVQEEWEDTDHRIRAARAQGRVGELQMKLGEAREAEESFRAALERLEQTQPETAEHTTLLNATRRTTIQFLARSLSQAGRYADMGKLLIPLVAELREDLQKQPSVEVRRSLSQVLGLLARSQYRQRNFADSEKNYRESGQLLSEIPAEEQTRTDRTELSMIHTSLANMFRSRGDIARASEEYEQSIAKMRVLLDEFPDSVHLRSSFVLTVTNFAGLLIELAEFDRAFELTQEVGPDVDQLVADYPEVALHRELRLSSLMTKATAYAQSGGDPHTARQFYDEAIAFAEECDSKIKGSSTVLANLSMLHGNLAFLLVQQLNDPTSAENHYRRHVEFARRLTSEFPQAPAHRQTLAEAIMKQAKFLKDQGQYESAAEAFKEAEQESSNAIQSNPGNPKCVQTLLDALSGQAVSLCLSGQHSQSLAAAQRIAAMNPESAESCLLVAHVTAECVGFLRKSEVELKTSMTTPIDQYQQQVLQFLKASINAGLQDRTVLNSIAEKAELGANQDYQSLIKNLP